MGKVDLTMIKRLVSELEAGLNLAESVQLAGDKIGAVVEFNKAAGLAAGIMAEGALLMGDIQVQIAGPASAGSQDFISKILGTKGSGPIN